MARKKRKKPSRTLTAIYGPGPKKRKVRKKTKRKPTGTGMISKKNLNSAKRFLGKIQKEAQGFDMYR